MILIDPASIAIPNFASSDDEVEKLIDRLIEYAELIRSDIPINVYIDDQIEDKLGDLYPSFDTIRDYLEIYNLDHVFDPRDIVKQIGAILSRSIRWSDGNLPVVKSYDSLEVQPALPPSLFPSELVKETYNSLLMVSIASDQIKSFYLSSPFPDYTLRDYSVTANCLCIINAENSLEIPKFSGISRTFPEIIQIITIDLAHELWENAQCEKDIFAAILFGGVATAVAAHKEISNSIKSFSLGSQFVESLRRNQAFGNNTYSREVATTCFEIISGTFGGSERMFGRTSAQIRQRDSASGRRCHVTRAGLGLRLMYWNRNDHFEFSNIGPKRELVIEDGTVSGEIKYDLDSIISLILRSQLKFKSR